MFLRRGLVPQCTLFRITRRSSAKKNEGKGKKDIKMDARRRSVNKYDANKRFVTKASDDHTSEPM